MRTRNFTRRFRKHASKHIDRSRHPRLERLEDRRVMAVDFVSAFASGGAGTENVRDLVLDSSGNMYLVGKFTNTVDFDLSEEGTYELTSSPVGSRTNYVAKYDPSGSFVWAQQFGGDANEGTDRELAFDGSGNVFVAGTFTGSATFGSTTLTSAGMSDAFLTKLDSAGNFSWTRQIGGANDDRGNGVAVDSAGNALIIADTAAGSSGTRDATIRKFDPSGITIWSTVVGGSSSIPTKGKPTPTGSASGANITVDAAGHVYATGTMNGTVDFNAGAGTTAASGLAFVMKLNSAGALTWARAFEKGGSPSSTPQVSPSDIAVDASGNVFSTGSFILSVDFDPGAQKTQKFFLNAGSRSNYVSALDSSGNFLWAKSTRSLGTANTDEATLAIDGMGGIYVAGSINGPTDFDPGANTFALTPADYDAFVWKLDTGGNFVWAVQMGGTSADFARAMDVDGAGNIFVAGNFSGTADFDPGPGTHELPSDGGYDFFVAKLTQTSSLALATSTATTSSSRSRAAVIDVALEGLEDRAWPELVVDF